MSPEEKKAYAAMFGIATMVSVALIVLGAVGALAILVIKALFKLAGAL
jgi:hypothetical protein